MDSQFVIDCGSRSIKLHEARPGAVTLRATRSWDPINDAATVGSVEALLADLTKGLAVPAIHVVGTAAARRDARVAGAIERACNNRGWTYETLSQSGEANLILDAFGGPAHCDIVNAGGGSIQIVRPAKRRCSISAFPTSMRASASGSSRRSGNWKPPAILSSARCRRWSVPSFIRAAS